MVKVVCHPETGSILTQSERNPEISTLRVDSMQNAFINGFFRIEKRTAFIPGRNEDLEALVASMNLKDGSQMDGKIVRQESYNPFYEGQSPKMNPTTGEIVLTNGRETYLNFEYTPDVNAVDTWVENATAAVAAEELPQGAPERA